MNNMEKTYVVYENELRELIHDSLKLMALENGGVDNWEWYGDSLNDFLNRNGEEDFYKMAEKELSNYDELTD